MILHFVSTGPKFPYPYYIGVMTALKAHKGKVKLWITETPKSPYFDLLKDKVEVTKVRGKIPHFPALEGADDHFKRVAIFDYLIWKIVSKEGGIIMGLDSVTLKDWQGMLEKGKEILAPIDSENFAKDQSFSMHGVIVRKGSKLAKKIAKDSKKALMGKSIKFGDPGILPYLTHVRKNLDKVTVSPYGTVGGCNHDRKPFYLWQKDGQLLNPDARTIPLYATSEANVFGKIDENFVRNSGTLYSRLVKKSLTEKEWDPLPKDPLKEKFRFHYLGLAHLPISERYMGCAFTQKIVKLSKMLLSLGHEVYLYGAEGSDAPCTKFIQTHTLKDIRHSWGEGDNRFEIGYDWHNKGFKHDFSIQRTPTTIKFYGNAIAKISKYKRDDDFLLLSMGDYQKPVANAVGLHLTCEPGVGYRGSYTRFRAFESAYLQNFTYGSEHPRKSIDGNYYDRVIPNYFDPKDFEFCEKKGDYFLYIGRMIQRKGVWTAIKATRAIGAKLVLAGQADPEIKIEQLPDHCKFVGYVEPKERNRLMKRARAVFVPTIYLEAFGGVAVEAQLCGTPVITTNFGVFPETVVQGVTGYRCNTLNDFVEATKKVNKLKPRRIRRHAERYLMDNVKQEFQRWFEELYQLYLSTKDSNVKAWHHLR